LPEGQGSLGAREADLARGREIQRLVGGATAAQTTRAGADALTPDLGPLSDEVNWGRIWGRDGLDLRTRSLCVVTCLLTLGRTTQAFGHMQGARRLGVSREELAEAVLQLTFYAGLPVVNEGLALVRRAYEEPLPE
jgi:4-carboxymuconolactone decarboxylase